MLIMVLLAGMVGVTCWTIIYVLFWSGNENVSSIIALITSIGGTITSFIVLPKVIADNLFPSKDDDKTTETFREMIKYDLDVRKLHYHSEEEVFCKQKIVDKEKSLE